MSETMPGTEAQQERDVISELRGIKRELQEELGGRLEAIATGVEPILKPMSTAEKEPSSGEPPPSQRCIVMKELAEVHQIIAHLCRASDLIIDRIDI